ncbi:MAG: alpha/beta fold hydrolase, partial [Candidatus Solibacter usitatus]|nr:alpha/beta fold hydrolase [Candidatus Solibacter usitatus]
MRTLLVLLTASVCAHAADLAGKWLGTLKAGPAELRIAFQLEKTPGGEYKGTMDSLDQGVRGIVLDKITVEGNSMRLEIPAAKGSYEGKLNAAGNELDGTWTQGPASLRMLMKRVTELPKVNRPQTPKKPYPYQEIEVVYENKAQNVKLAGTLTTPRDVKSAPAVLLITGSGQQDRDETIFEHKPFLVIADYLTRRGIAVLRVDDRGIGGSTGDPATSTSLDFATDVMAGIEFLKSRPEIDAKRIGLIGHSEGGLIAPIVASRTKDVAFLILLAGPGVNGREVLREQAALIIRAMGGGDDAIAENRKVQQKIFEVLSREPDDAKAKAEIGAAAGMMEASRSATPWMRTFLKLDPADFLKKVTCPVLAINGSLDLQVSPKQNLPAMEAALKQAGNKDFTLKEMPSLNHLLQRAKRGDVGEYANLEQTIAP